MSAVVLANLFEQSLLEFGFESHPQQNFTEKKKLSVWRKIFAKRLQMALFNFVILLRFSFSVAGRR